MVESIAAETVRRVLATNQLKPWRQHAWLSPQVPRDRAFAEAVAEICSLYTRPLADDERVICLDEKTSLQPRGRSAPTRPAARGTPVHVEHEYRRAGALNLFAAFDTRTGQVIGLTAPRKRASECIAFLKLLDELIPANVTVVHVVLDNLRVHKGKAVSAWLAAHPRFVFHYPPVHCSWMNQIEQWFGILQRKALAIADFPGLPALAERIGAFIDRWNRSAHPFNWTTRSISRVMATCANSETIPSAA